MKKLFFVMAIISFVVACDKLSGFFKSDKNIVLVDKQDKQIPIKKGEYPLKIDINQKKSRLEFSLNKHVFYFHVPNYNLEDTSFSVNSEENGQPYDISFNVEKTQSLSEEYFGYESCILYYQHQLVCSHHGCYYETFPVNGIRKIYFHYEYVDIKIVGNLHDALEEFSKFNAIKSDTYRVIDSVGYCH